MDNVDSTDLSSSSESNQELELSSLSGMDKLYRRNTIEEKRGGIRNTKKKQKRSALLSSREVNCKEVTQQRLVLAQERLSLEKRF